MTGGTPISVPFRLALAGPMGAGKSTVGRRVAARRGVEFVDLDEAIGDIPALFAREGEAAFRRRESSELERCAGRDGVLALGGGTLGSAENRALLAGWTVIVLMARLDTLRARIGAGVGRPLAASLAELVAARTPIWETYAPWIWTDELDPDGAATEVEAACAAR